LAFFAIGAILMISLRAGLELTVHSVKIQNHRAKATEK
jgi:hypothetical protein